MSNKPTPATEPKVEQWHSALADLERIATDDHNLMRSGKATLTAIKHLRHVLEHHTPPASAPTERVREAVIRAIEEFLIVKHGYIRGGLAVAVHAEELATALAPHLAPEPDSDALALLREAVEVIERLEQNGEISPDDIRARRYVEARDKSSAIKPRIRAHLDRSGGGQ